jgi:hypothetical protein
VDPGLYEIGHGELMKNSSDEKIVILL